MKRAKNNELGSQQDPKSRRKLVQNAYKWSNDRFWWKLRPNVDQIISWTKCDRDKQIFFLQKELVNQIKLAYKIKGTQWDWKMPTKGVNLGQFPTTLSRMGVPPPPWLNDSLGSLCTHSLGCSLVQTLILEISVRFLFTDLFNDSLTFIALNCFVDLDICHAV